MAGTMPNGHFSDTVCIINMSICNKRSMGSMPIPIIYTESRVLKTQTAFMFFLTT